MKTPELINAQDMAKENPETFYAPSKEELDGVNAKDSVKVCAGKERFWVTVTKVNGEIVEGVVDNDLVCSDEHGLIYKDNIKFNKNNIYNIF